MLLKPATFKPRMVLLPPVTCRPFADPAIDEPMSALRLNTNDGREEAVHRHREHRQQGTAGEQDEAHHVHPRRQAARPLEPADIEQSDDHRAERGQAHEGQRDRIGARPAWPEPLTPKLGVEDEEREADDSREDRQPGPHPREIPAAREQNERHGEG